MFTLFNTRWGENVQEINLEKGTLETAYQIDYAYIENPKVRNGYLYFLYKNEYYRLFYNFLFFDICFRYSIIN